MAKQIYTGPPANVRRYYYAYTPHEDNDNDLYGWKYRDKEVHSRHPCYDLYTWVRMQSGSMSLPPYIGKAVCLWWNGARWVAWIVGVFYVQDTDFQDINDPPMEWAEGVYKLANS